MEKRLDELCRELQKLLDEYEELSRAREQKQEAEIEALIQKSDDADPLFRKFRESRVQAARNAVKAETVRRMQASGLMKPRWDPEKVAGFRELFEQDLAASERYQKALAAESALDLDAADREKYRKLVRGKVRPDEAMGEALTALKAEALAKAGAILDELDIPERVKQAEAEEADAFAAHVEKALEKERREASSPYLSEENILLFLNHHIGDDGLVSATVVKKALYKQYNGKKQLENAVLQRALPPEDKEAVKLVLSADSVCKGNTFLKLYTKALAKTGITERVVSAARQRFPRTAVYEILLRNPLYKGLYERHLEAQTRSQRIQKGLLAAIPESYPDLFPLARRIKRHFVLHVGPTNSGKSHDAIEALKKAANGVYLAPLRLLAYEKFEELNEAGVNCTMKTGEEEIPIPFSTVQSSTIEILDYTARYDVAVIDEAQMVADSQRGAAWTMAILGIQADVIQICLAPEAQAVIIALIKACGDTWEIIRHERLVPLEYERKPPLSFPYTVPRGTAFIVFSRRDVHAVAAELQRKKHRCSVIYGALPYDVRRNEVKRYLSRETDIVVATDAIGMGMNLPIERIVFLETEKFDGKNKRPLTDSEIKQIAGRAGRYGLYEKGYVSSLSGQRLVERALHAETEPIREARISFPFSLLGIEGRVSELMRRWAEIPPKPGFEVADMSIQIALAEELEQRTDEKDLVYRFVMFPFEEKNPDIKALWLELFEIERTGDDRDILSFLPPPPSPHTRLDTLEVQFKICDLLYRYADSFRLEHSDALPQIAYRKNEISRRIIDHLSKGKLSPKTYGNDRRNHRQASRTAGQDYDRERSAVPRTQEGRQEHSRALRRRRRRRKR